MYDCYNCNVYFIRSSKKESCKNIIAPVPRENNTLVANNSQENIKQRISRNRALSRLHIFGSTIFRTT